MQSRRTVHLVGRSGEAGELERVWRRVCDGGGPAGVLVQGPAGVGKSRLIEQTTTALVGAQEIRMLGRCVDLYGTAIPYGGASDAVRDLIRRHGVEPTRAWSGRFGTALASLIPDIDPEVTEVAPGSLLEGFATLLDNAAAARPVWLWIEDLHWSDVGTRALVSYVMRTVRAPQLMVTCTLRTQEPAPSYDVLEFWTELRRLPHVSAVELQPFNRREVAEHWDALGGGPTPARHVDRVLELSGGLPFYTELLAGSGWTVERPVPPTLRELAASPMARLSANARCVVEAASVEEGRLPHGVMRDVMDAQADVDNALAEAVATGVLTLEEGGAGYRFRHALIREAVAAALLPPARSRWHARWAARLEEAASLEAEPFAQIAAAHHWMQADDPSRAFDAALAAAELAGRIVALDEEAKLLTEALEIWPRVGNAEERTGYTRDDLLRSVVVLLAFLPDLPGLLRLTERELAGPAGDPVRNVVLRDFWRRFRDSDDAAGGGAPVVDRAAADLLLRTPLDHSWLARAAHEVSAQFWSDEPALADRLTRRALASARLLTERMPPPRAYLPMTPEVDVVVASVGMAAVRVATGDLDAAARILEGAPRNVGPRQVAHRLDCNLAATLGLLGHHREAITATQRALEGIVEPHRAPLLWGDVMVQQAESQLALGWWDEAERTLTRCSDVLADDAVTGQVMALAGLLACWRGRPAEAAALLDRVQASPMPDPIPADLVRPRWLAAQLAVSRHDLAGLRRALDPLWLQDGPRAASDYLWQPLLLELRVEVDALSRSNGESDAAWQRVELCRRVADCLHRSGDTGVAWDLHLNAELELAGGSCEPSRWETVGAAWDKVGRVHEGAWARLRQSACLAMHRQRDEALALIDEVRHTAADLGAVPVDEAARALATRIDSGGRRRRDAPAGLTLREQEVLLLLASGRSNAQIAEELFISPKTVSIHVSAILGKLHAASRTEAVAAAQRSGILRVRASADQR